MSVYYIIIIIVNPGIWASQSGIFGIKNYNKSIVN